MKYTEDELKSIILPMIQSLGSRPAEELTGAIVELIKQDREVRDSNLFALIRNVYANGFTTFEFKDKVYRITEEKAGFDND